MAGRNFHDFDPNALQQALLQPLPGAEAQLRLAHPDRSLLVPEGITPREAAVLVLLFPDAEGKTHFPLIQRSSHIAQDRHRGQISLPGGKRESTDASLLDTALREAQEEVGVDIRDLEVLGQLSNLYIPVSNFLVTPTVAICERQPRWQAQLSEVVEIFEAPLLRLHHTDVIGHTDIAIDSHLKLRSVPYFDLAGQIVWGATAMILSELRQLLPGYSSAQANP